MRKLLLAGVAVFSLGTAASAADLAARPYTKAPALAPGYNWSGFYAGVMGGYAWATNGNGSGGFGGGTLGYNWQAPGSQYVFGIEVDGAGSDVKASVTQTLGGVTVTATNKIEAFGSVTGRAGIAMNAALFYIKGGYGWAENKASFAAIIPGVAAASGSDSHLHSGYTVGGGLEYMFAPNWSAKAEYMYANYASQTYTLAGTSFASGDLETHSVKVGVNYHFN
jgi:outer membrane immunogenic protein